MSDDIPTFDLDGMAVEIDRNDPWKPKIYLYDKDTNERIAYLEIPKTIHPGDKISVTWEVTF